jgi:hypothetical protein
MVLHLSNSLDPNYNPLVLTPMIIGILRASWRIIRIIALKLSDLFNVPVETIIVYAILSFYFVSSCWCLVKLISPSRA